MEAYSVRDIPSQGINLDKKLQPDWIEANLNHGVAREELTVSAEHAGRAALKLRKIDPDAAGDPVVRVSGVVEARIKTYCVRCLSKVELNVQGDVNQMLFPASMSQNKGDASKSKGKSKDEDIALISSADDLDDDIYRNQEIDLPSIVRESILLELDMNTVCDDATSCETRTKEMLTNASDPLSGPPARKIDPRWAALEKIQLKSE